MTSNSADLALSSGTESQHASGQPTATSKYRIAIIGPGQIGGFLAVLLSQPATNCTVTLHGRMAVDARMLTAGWLDERNQSLQSDAVPLTVNGDWRSIAQADLVLLTVKATALAAVCQQLQSLLPASKPLVACQNGLGITELIRQYLPNPLFQLIVPFNVVLSDNGLYQQTSAGQLICQKHQSLQTLQHQLRKVGVPLQTAADMRPVIYGKLLLNLNNALNAISDLPLRQQLQQRAWRQLLAQMMEEWLACCKAEGVKPAQLTKLPPALLPRVLRLPNWLFSRIASAMLRIAPEARLSMWHDLQKAQATEIAFLNGAVLQVASTYGIAAPANQLVTQWVRQLEQHPDRHAGVAAISAVALLQKLRAKKT